MIIECQQCEAFVEAEEITGYEYMRTATQPSGRYLLLKCLKCDSPILVSQNNIGNMVEGDIWDTPARLYPSDDIRVNPNAPKPIRLAYGEAAVCFRARAYTAAAIMCRKTLEGICEAHGVQGLSLVKALEKMKNDKLIDDRLYEWADALRLAGNEAVHDVKVTVPSDDAKDMLEFTNAILDYLFSFRDKFDRFKQRRKKGT
ncbi:MAG: DUF4145 domain-containing protein [Nitrososphaera sp.]|nr:DUF4145 domain-containing protein [Nitrososphaera sp.]